MRLPYSAFFSLCVTCTIVVPSLFSFLNKLHDFFSLAGMQVSGWLIGQNQLRVGNHRARNSHQLLLAAGKLIWIEVLLAHHIEAIERVAHDALPLRLS